MTVLVPYSLPVVKVVEPQGISPRQLRQRLRRCWSEQRFKNRLRKLIRRRVFLQALQAERVEVGGDLAVELRRRRRVRIQNLLHEQLLVSLGAEGAFAGQQLEQNHPHGPSVRAAIDGVAVLPLLRRHVRGGTEQLTRLRHHVLGLGVTLERDLDSREVVGFAVALKFAQSEFAMQAGLRRLWC